MRFPLVPLLLLIPLAATLCTPPYLLNLTTSLHLHISSNASLFPSLLFPTYLSPSLTFSSNRHPLPWLNSTFSVRKLPITLARAQHDSVGCATYSEFVSVGGGGMMGGLKNGNGTGGDFVIGVQMRLGQGDGKVTSIDVIETTNGDWAFNASATAMWAGREKWGRIEEGRRDSRQTLKAAADAYCDIFNDKSVVVPWGTPCARLEGGWYTGNGSQSDRCDIGIPSGVALVNRQYVIDEEYGTVDVMMDFAGEEGQVGKKGLPDSHEFRIEGGRIRYVHTMSSCGGKGCL